MLPNVVLFQGADATNTQGLWETDGTASGTKLVTNGPFVYGFQPYPTTILSLTVLGDKVLFAGREASGKYELWTTNGTASGTMELTSIAGAGTTGVGLKPTGLTALGAKVLFNGIDSAGKNGLWATMGPPRALRS